MALPSRQRLQAWWSGDAPIVCRAPRCNELLRAGEIESIRVGGSRRSPGDGHQAATHARRRAAVQLRAAGLSVPDVGCLLDVSHQRVSLIRASESHSRTAHLPCCDRQRCSETA